MPPTTLNSEEPVNLLDTWGETIPFFRERGEVSGLADVDM